MCANHGIATNSTNDNVPGLLSLITAHLKDLPDDGRNEDVFKMLRSSAAILHGINNLRNNYSMAHPTGSAGMFVTSMTGKPGPCTHGISRIW